MLLASGLLRALQTMKLGTVASNLRVLPAIATCAAQNDPHAQQNQCIWQQSVCNVPYMLPFVIQRRLTDDWGVVRQEEVS